MAEAGFLAISEVAALLRLGEPTTYDVARKGEFMGAVRAGSQWHVGPRALPCWIERSGQGMNGRCLRREVSAS